MSHREDVLSEMGEFQSKRFDVEMKKLDKAISVKSRISIHGIKNKLELWLVQTNIPRKRSEEEQVIKLVTAFLKECPSREIIEEQFKKEIELAEEWRTEQLRKLTGVKASVEKSKCADFFARLEYAESREDIGRMLDKYLKETDVEITKSEEDNILRLAGTVFKEKIIVTQGKVEDNYRKTIKAAEFRRDARLKKINEYNQKFKKVGNGKFMDFFKQFLA